ncbi:hypothetical protein [Streptomyces sp. H27-D2]|uniref:hypothetical protein n=1 Tax=Streptomyces sp. H27-D2 TaxID=3046304 RepID=UPI002DB5EA3A|nr:hypothetical protein [Streptomyces sp. H27-D2]MEC4015424.1 hypothetical protein [Streptomyces sp. H27-D2]
MSTYQDRRPHAPSPGAGSAQLVAGATAGAEHEAAAQAARQGWQRMIDRADALARLAREGRLTDAVPAREGDEAALDYLCERGSWRVPVVDGWLAQALADRTGHYADTTAREAAAGQLPEQVTARAALLSALARTGAPARDRELAFVGRLAQADPEAVAQLAVWLDDALADGPARPDGRPPVGEP